MPTTADRKGEGPPTSGGRQIRTLGDPSTTSDEEFRSAIRTEYTTLRSQIEKTDGICQLALFALFTAALAMAKVATDAITAPAVAVQSAAQVTGPAAAQSVGLAAPAARSALDSTASGAAWLISFLWLAGYIFLSEKRHVIVKTAYYISSQLEPRHPGLGWERWHLGGAEGRSFWRWDPHYLETAISAGVLTLSFLFMLSLEGWRLTIWVGATIVTLLAFAYVAIRSIWHYRIAVDRLKTPVQQSL